MKFRRHYSIKKGELNLTPLVDVVLLQLIYFMLTSSFIMQPGIKIKLPTATTTEKIEKKEIFVSVSKEGLIFFKERCVSIDELEKLLLEEKKRNKNLIIVIKGDKDAKHGDIVKVMDVARKTGIEKIAIATMPKIE
ncbi:MAG: biopolymer transporter ExbD [Candidatus Omnitrophota bacterium]|nr:MAG: biopolymer transporter ExbD [Candidatus Omnitrophota bacterium]